MGDERKHWRRKKSHRENNVKRFFIDGRKAVDAGGRQRRAKQRYKEERGEREVGIE